MGNKCCSKRQDQELYPSGYNKNDTSFSSNISGQKHNNGGSLDARYTPDPNRGPKLTTKGGVDIIRTTPCKLLFYFSFITLFSLLF